MNSKTTVFLLLVVLSAFLSSSYGKTIVKRSPQLMLTVSDEPEEEEIPREHPPSPEDIEERRKKLVKALVPGGGGGGAVGAQLQTLGDLGVDLLSGGRTAELFAPLVNATRKATANLPRVGDVINRAVDSVREYRKQARGAWRETASANVNNGVKVFTTFTARATETLGGVFKLLRTLVDNLTFAIQNLARRLSTGLVTFANTSTNFLSRNFMRARNLLKNQRLFQPAKDAAELGGNLVRGLAQDFTSLQPLVSEGVKSKLTVGTRLIPRVRLTSILSPLGDAEPCNNDDHDGGETGVDIGDGGYGKKREEEGSDEGGEENKMSLEDIPKDVLELLGSSKSEKKAKPEDDDGTTPASKAKQDSSEVSKGKKKSSPKSTTTVKRSTTTIAATSSTTTTKPVTTVDKTSKSSKNKSSSSSSSGERTSFVEDLFGLSDST